VLDGKGNVPKNHGKNFLTGGNKLEGKDSFRGGEEAASSGGGKTNGTKKKGEEGTVRSQRR